MVDFHPLIHKWLDESFSAPTDVQIRAWPLIHEREHVLVSAPTGSGKTLTAFLSAIDGFARCELDIGETQVLYVSPLKALNNDIQRNLQQPLQELQELFTKHGEFFPPIRVMTRSGDTPQNERQRMLRKPPEILVTTPESLSLLLTTVDGRQSLATVKTVILDEIHAVLDSRRGVVLSVCLERLVEIAGEFQRVALSATVEPIKTVARFVAGIDHSGKHRKVQAIESPYQKQIDLTIAFPEAAKMCLENSQPIWDVLLDSFRTRIQENESSLVFVNSRRLAEKITLGLNDRMIDSQVYSHHGSLSKDIRLAVESRFKNGDLQAIVATSSLELGIDIGDLDEVLLVQSPPSIASAMQRIGRAGHRVDEVSRAILYPIHARDFIDALVLSDAIKVRNLEPLKPIEAPLDCLSQIVVSMVATEPWNVDALFGVVTRAFPYQQLTREQFDSVLDMLVGKFEDTRIRDLRPRIAVDKATQTISIRKGAVFAFYVSGGTIPDRGYYQLKTDSTGDKIGELDEEFVWEAKIGQRFTFGSHQWRIQRITHNDVFVTQSKSGADAPPFWLSETINRSFHFANLIGDFLNRANTSIRDGNIGNLKSELIESGFESVAADELVEFLTRQRSVTSCDLPHSNHIVAEFVRSGPAGYKSNDVDGQLVIHTCWGGRVNRPFGYALESLWRTHFEGEPDIFADNHVVVVQMKHEVSPAAILELFRSADVQTEMRKSLESTGFFGGRFRECAGRALLLTKKSFSRRMPLWMTRMQAKQLMTATSKYTDFPILLETWRTCLNDEFDMEAVSEVSDRLSRNEIEISFIELHTPSPFASDAVFDQVSRYMYADDTPERKQMSSLSDTLIDDVIANPASRPVLKRESVDAIEGKIQRRLPGYAPDDEVELAHWLKERVWIRTIDWFEDTEIVDSAVRFVFEAVEWIAHQESIDLAERDIDSAFTNAIQFFGPRTREQFHSLFPLPHTQIDSLLDDLIEAGVLVDDVQVEGTRELYVCDRWNYEAILRYQRSAARRTVVTQSVRNLPWFLANHHRFGSECNAANTLDAMERLRGFVAPVAVWMHDIWGSRLEFFDKNRVLATLTEHDVVWNGDGKNRVSFGLPEDFPTRETPNAATQIVLGAFKDASANYSFTQLVDSTGQTTKEFNRALWDAVWDGYVTNDSFMTLEKGMERKYEVPMRSPFGSRPRGSISRARSSVTWPGFWRRIDRENDETDSLSELDNIKDQCRILLSRYGVLTREIVNREGGQYRWGRMFRSLRLMELSGEVVSGLFFDQLSGPQFALAEILTQLDPQELPVKTYWINTMDPVSPAGLGLDWPGLPSRRVTSHCGFANAELMLVSESNGKKLSIIGDIDSSSMHELLEGLQQAVSKGKRLEVEFINDIPAISSDLLGALSNLLPFKRSHSSVFLDSIDF